MGIRAFAKEPYNAKESLKPVGENKKKTFLELGPQLEKILIDVELIHEAAAFCLGHDPWRHRLFAGLWGLGRSANGNRCGGDFAEI